MVLAPISMEQINIPVSALMSIDGSTTITGVAILRNGDGALMCVMAFTREEGESPVRYKVQLKRAIESILRANPNINKTYYEEPFIGRATAAPNLFMLRTFIEEMVIENEPEFDYLLRTEVNNKTWKRLFLKPDKCPTGSEIEKAAVKKKLLAALPFLDGSVTQDEIDAIAIGFVAATALEGEKLSSSHITPFKYNTKFIGANDDESAFDDILNIWEGPKSVIENGISYIQIKARTNFEKQVFTAMGSEDKLVIVRYNSDDHANITLKHNIGALAANHTYIYAFIWRKTRKN